MHLEKKTNELTFIIILTVQVFCTFLVIVKNKKDLPICVKYITEITKYLAALTNCRKPI